MKSSPISPLPAVFVNDRKVPLSPIRQPPLTIDPQSGGPLMTENCPDNMDHDDASTISNDSVDSSVVTQVYGTCSIPQLQGEVSEAFLPVRTLSFSLSLFDNLFLHPTVFLELKRTFILELL